MNIPKDTHPRICYTLSRCRLLPTESEYLHRVGYALTGHEFGLKFPRGSATEGYWVQRGSATEGYGVHLTLS